MIVILGTFSIRTSKPSPLQCKRSPRLPTPCSFAPPLPPWSYGLDPGSILIQPLCEVFHYAFNSLRLFTKHKYDIRTGPSTNTPFCGGSFGPPWWLCCGWIPSTWKKEDRLKLLSTGGGEAQGRGRGEAQGRGRGEAQDEAQGRGGEERIITHSCDTWPHCTSLHQIMLNFDLKVARCQAHLAKNLQSLSAKVQATKLNGLLR